MQQLLYLFGRGCLWLLQLLPMRGLAQVGRIFGRIAWCVDARHRRVALANLELVFRQEYTPAERRAIARENFARIGEAFLCSAKTSVLSAAELRQCVEFPDLNRHVEVTGGGSRSLVMAIGHFGNFELFTSAAHFVTGYKMIATYRALRQPGLNRLLLEQRQRTGCILFERRFDSAQLKTTLKQGPAILGLLADQSGGLRGISLPFLGHPCSTSRAPALMALRYGMELYVAVCYRLRPGAWRVEFSDRIPTQENGQPRPMADIMLDVNRIFDEAVRRDPANWFWVHRRWKIHTPETPDAPS